MSGKLNSLYKHANAFITAGSGKIILLDTSWFNTAVWGLDSLKGQIMSYDKTHAFGVLAHKSFSNSYKHDVFEVGQEGYLLFCKSLSGTDAAASRRRRAGNKSGNIAYVWSNKDTHTCAVSPCVG